VEGELFTHLHHAALFVGTAPTEQFEAFVQIPGPSKDEFPLQNVPDGIQKHEVIFPASTSGGSPCDRLLAA
jgi:hypothetical protein